MFELPTSVSINGEQFNIRNKGDFRVILDCFSALQDEEIPDESERVMTALVIFYEGLNFDSLYVLEDLESAVKEMYKFFNAGAEENALGTQTNYKLVDWQKDEQLIASAVNTVAHTEIRALPYIHWWTFLGYYTAIGECPFSNIISIRYKIKAGKKLEKHEQEFRRNNPEYFIWNDKSIEDKEADMWVHELWNKGD